MDRPQAMGDYDTEPSSHISPSRTNASTNSFEAGPRQADEQTSNANLPLPGAENPPMIFPQQQPLVDLDGMPWPWLHETLFLQDDPIAFEYNAQHSSELDLNGALGGPQWQSEDPGFGTLRGLDGLPVTHEAGEQRLATDPKSSTNLAGEVDMLVDLATKSAFEGAEDILHQQHWRDTVRRLGSQSEEIRALSPSSLSAKEYFLKSATAVHMQKFNPLWPLFSEEDFDLNVINPILYLVLASIGLMYGSQSQKHCGSLLHKRLRRLLTASLFDLEGPEGDLTWLAQARLLTQVQGLYFGQQQGFSYAQHLGAILTAQSRKLSLFVQREPDTWASDECSLTDDVLSEWTHQESRKRLAFGIFRADIFTSVLLNTRPMLTFEEVDIPFPCSDVLWHNSNRLSPREKLMAIRMEAQMHPPVLFSDLMRILFDRGESLPELGSVGYELCLFGLQLPIWRFSHDPDIFTRLTGAVWTGVSTIGPREADTGFDGSLDDLLAGHENEQPVFDLLGQVHRQMQDLRSDRYRISAALTGWHASFQARRTSREFASHRATLMSCLLLWHTSNLQLNAPLQTLHDISYRAAEGRPAAPTKVAQVVAWTSSPVASRALDDAVSICTTISQEQSRAQDVRAKFNFLAFGSLHHAAVVHWAYSQLAGDRETCRETCRHSSQMGRLLRHGPTAVVLETCAGLFKNISPLGGASFEAAAESLSRTPFPRPTEELRATFVNG